MPVKNARESARPVFARNTTRNTVLAERGVLLRNVFRQAVGTMFHPLPGCYAFEFATPRQVSITNLFVFQSLDIMWLSASGTVLALREDFKPFTLFTLPNVSASAVLELPAGTIAHSRTRLGDVIAYGKKRL
jgi:uncharacterized membrane protein (UPF0127 family)